jgi:5'-nucleotidase/UDP-sugar diphosphatase
MRVKKRSILSTLVVTLVLFALIATPALARPDEGPSAAIAVKTQAMAGPEAKAVDLWLTVLHNNDGESKLINLGGTLTDFGGAARFKTLSDMLKWDATHGPRYGVQRGAKRGVLMVSSGDNFLAGPEFNVSLDKGVPFYDTMAMDLIGYDAVAIGNHDFDFGPDVLADFISGFQMNVPTYVSANLGFSEEPRLQALVEDGRIAKSVIVKERGDLIGVVGATTPALPYITSPRNVTINDDVAGAIEGEVDKLKAKGVNKIILISHLQSISEDLALIPYLDDIDVVVAGGGDELLANEGDLLIPGQTPYGPYPLEGTDMDGDTVPVVTTSGSYAYIGRLVVGFDKQGKVVALGDNSGPVRVAGGDYPDAVEAALAELATQVVATSEVPLNGVRSNVRTKETNEGDLIADSLLWQATQAAPLYGLPAPDVALQNGGGIRNDSVIPAGPITELDTFAMVPFANFTCEVPNVSRETFKALLENAVSRVEFTDGRFAQVAGFNFVYDASMPPGARVLDAELDDGTQIVTMGAVMDGPALNVATIDFLAKGGDQYPFGGAAFTTLGSTYQQALSNYLVDGLAGVISAADYPADASSRITRLN